MKMNRKTLTRYNTTLEYAENKRDYFKSQPSGYINGMCRQATSELIDEIKEYNETKEEDKYILQNFGTFRFAKEQGYLNYQTMSLQEAEEKLQYYKDSLNSKSIKTTKNIIKQIKEKYNLINKWNKKGKLDKFDSDITKYYVAIMLENIYMGDAN